MKKELRKKLEQKLNDKIIELLNFTDENAAAKMAKTVKTYSRDIAKKFFKKIKTEAKEDVKLLKPLKVKTAKLKLKTLPLVVKEADHQKPKNGKVPPAAKKTTKS